MEQYIVKSLVISGNHIPEEDMIRIDCSGFEDIACSRDEFAFTLYINEDTDYSTELHQQTRDLIRFAKNNEIEQIRFDCDGDVVPSLIKFNYD